jgi:hypothetical protein
MKDEKMHKGGGHMLMTIGILALVIGIVMWLSVAYSWPAYMGWIVGGILLLIIGWIKKMMKNM